MTYFGKDTVLLARNLPTLHSLPHAVVAALHQPPLELDRVAQVAVVLDLVAAAGARAQGLELGVELGVAALGQQEQQIQAGDLVPVPVPMPGIVGQLVEGLQLRHVAREGLGVLGADAEQGAGLVHLPREREVRGRRREGRRHGLELEEGDLGLGEELGGLAVGGVGVGFELREDLLEGALGHDQGRDRGMTMATAVMVTDGGGGDGGDGGLRGCSNRDEDVVLSLVIFSCFPAPQRPSRSRFPVNCEVLVVVMVGRICSVWRERGGGKYESTY